MITIKNGVGIINYEPASTDVDYRDDGDWHVRRFRIPAGNGYSLSVVFGTGSYSSNYDHVFNEVPWSEVVERAEIAVLSEDGQHGPTSHFEEEWGDTVKGHCDAGEIVYWLERLRRL